MQEIKTFTEGGLNWDTELHLLPAKDWIDAVNLRMSASDEQQEAAGINLEGNVRIGNYSYASGRNICIGAYADEFRNSVIAFICNENNFDEIIEITPATGAIVPVFKNLTWTNNKDITQFEPQYKIHSIDILHRADDEGDLIFWVDGNTRPRKINKKKGIAFGAAGGYPSPIIYDYTTVAKLPPESPIMTWLSDLARTTNNVRGKLFQAQIRFLYDDFEKSVWSGWSNFTIPTTPFDQDRDSDPAINNYINITFPTGNQLVIKVELGIRQNIGSLWGDLALVETFDKNKLGIGDNTTFTYRFYNDASGVRQLPAETDLVYDFVPTKAGCQTLVNGNVLAYGDITEGLNFTDTLDVFMSSYESRLLVLAPGDNVLGYKNSAKYRFGLVYFDEYNRTDGVHNYQVASGNNNFEVDTTFYLGDSVASDNYNVYAPVIRAAISHQPPLWAKKYKWVRTKALTISKYFYYVVTAVGTSDVDNLYIKLDPLINSISKEGQLALSYDFVPGDRMRFVRRMKANDGTAGDLQVDLPILNSLKDPVIGNNTFSGSFLKVAKNTIADSFTIFAQYLVEIYSPSTINNNDFYYEFGPEYDVLNPGTANRYHQGQLVNQSAGIPATFEFFDNGDVYYRKRKKMTIQTVNENNFTFENIPVSDNSFADMYNSAVNGNGRAYVVDESIQEQRLPNMIRYGGSYIQDTFINKTNSFPVANIIDKIDRTFGAIRRLTIRDRQVRVFQELKCGWIPIQQQVLQTTNNNAVVSQSDQLLNDPQYYTGDFGIGNAPCSLATKNFADYFHDTNRGVICRLSLDGITPISIVAKMNRFAITEDVKYKEDTYTGFLPPFTDDVPGLANIFGTFDTRNNTYISAYQEIATYEAGPVRTVVNPAKTLSWDEGRNRFVCPDIKYHPEGMTCVKNQLITFQNGIPYIHNDKVNRCRFYGVDYGWGIESVFNDKFAIKKTFECIDVLSNVVTPVPSIITSLQEPDGVTSQESNLISQDFRLLEGHWHAVFLRDINSPGGIINGDTLKGGYLRVKLQVESAQSLVSLKAFGVSYIISQKNNQ